LFIKDLIDKACGAAIGFLHAIQIGEVFTSPLKSPSEALGGFKALSDAGDGFCEDRFAVRASKAAFKDLKFNAAASDWPSRQ